MIILQNMAAMNTSRQLGIVTKNKKKSTEKLSTGYKINRAADDAAGLAISEKMRKQIRGLTQGEENIEDGVGYVQVADGALEQVQDMLQRMNELSVQAANGTNALSDRKAIDEEIQQLKTEMDRVFQTTKFNETYIWPDAETRIVGIAPQKQQAVTVRTPSKTIRINNSNYDVIALGSYSTTADDTGVSISWTGYNGKDYTTDTISWDELKENGYRFNIGDVFRKTDTELFDAQGKPVFDFTIAYSVLPEAKTADIIKAINGNTIGRITDTDMDGSYEDSNTNRGVSILSESLYYPAAYASHANSTKSERFDFETQTDLYLEAWNPATSANRCNLVSDPCKDINSTVTAADVAAAGESTDGWTFKFQMEGIGEVTAQSTSVSYSATSAEWSDADDENYWWEYRWRTYNGRRERYQATLTKSSSEKGAGTLGSVMAALTGAKGTATPGLLTKANGGDTDHGGGITIDFNVTADNSYSYGKNNSSTVVGSFSLYIPVSASDTETSILQKIKNTLNSNTILDFSSRAGVSSHYVYSNSAKQSLIDVPTYMCEEYWPQVDIPIHCGADSTDRLNIRYETMRIKKLGLEKTSVRTEEMALNAINEIADALQAVNAQRSAFGAYQNRLEHAAKINANTSENTQAAESVIRDTDMATEMVQYSNQNILQQAGESMLSQANHALDTVLQLLG